jgi:hypothetical protein
MLLGEPFGTNDLVQVTPVVVEATVVVKTNSREAAVAVAAGKFRLCASLLRLCVLTHCYGNGKVALDACSEG